VEFIFIGEEENPWLSGEGVGGSLRESGKGWKTLEKVGKFWKVWKSVERDRGAWPPKTMAFGFSVVEFVLDGVLASRLAWT